MVVSSVPPEIVCTILNKTQKKRSERKVIKILITYLEIRSVINIMYILKIPSLAGIILWWWKSALPRVVLVMQSFRENSDTRVVESRRQKCVPKKPSF